MGILSILEHKSSSYGPRTYTNAHEGDVTIALALDYNTAGERLTHKAAGAKYLKLELCNFHKDNARWLWRRLRKDELDSPTINVAGNGIYNMNKHGWTQKRINEYMLALIRQCHEFLPIGKIISGGQTGVDIAGAWAGYHLGIDTQVLLPKGYIQRHEDGIDVTHTQNEIRQQIIGE